MRPRDDQPCRHACRHFDCMMSRGEPLPAWVVAYQDGSRYHDTQARLLARDLAVRIVDDRRGYSIEYAPDPATHELEYQAETARILSQDPNDPEPPRPDLG